MRLLENLTFLMQEKNMNRTELAKEIGIAPSTINSWYNRNCDNISLSTLIKLSGSFNISMEELINGYPAKKVIFDELDKCKLIELCNLYSSKTLHIFKNYLEENNDK